MGWSIEIKQMRLSIPRRCCILLPKQLAPRKGTVTLQRQRRCPSRQKQLTPRKGTVTQGHKYHLPIIRETTPTPQGDGNFSFCVVPSFASPKQPPPRKGTVTTSSPARTITNKKQPPPRKGTVTPTLNGLTPHWTKQPPPRKGTVTGRYVGPRRAPGDETTPTPQGDGNCCAERANVCACCGNNPHPARGRELGVLVVELVGRGNNSRPARGR